MQPPRGTPTLTSAWYGLLSAMTAAREKRGQGWCERWGVGRSRKILNQIVPPGVMPIEALRSPELREGLDNQREALAIYVAHCRLCPHKDCSMRE